MKTTRSDARPGRRSVRPLVLTWLALLVLLALSTGAAQLHLGGVNLVVSLLIAALKTGLVVGIFMEWRKAAGLARAAAVAGCIGLMLMVGLSLVDWWPRAALPKAPWQQPAVVKPAL